MREAKHRGGEEASVHRGGKTYTRTHGHTVSEISVGREREGGRERERERERESE